MPDLHVVPDASGRGDWAVTQYGSTLQDALSQQTAINAARRLGTVGDTIYVHTPDGIIRDEFTITG